MTGTAEREFLSAVKSLTPAQIICQQCQLYQQFVGKPPASIMITHRLVAAISREFEFCCPVGFMVTTKETEADQPHASIVILIDEHQRIQWSL